MTEYSAVAPPQQNFNQSTAFAAALQRAKQVSRYNKGFVASTVSFTFWKTRFFYITWCL